MINEWKIVERLMRMGNEARKMKSKLGAFDLNSLRKLAVKQLTLEQAENKQIRFNSFEDWTKYITNCTNLQNFDIFVYKDNILQVQRYSNEKILDVVKKMDFIRMNNNIPVFNMK